MSSTAQKSIFPLVAFSFGPLFATVADGILISCLPYFTTSVWGETSRGHLYMAVAAALGLGLAYLIACKLGRQNRIFGSLFIWSRLLVVVSGVGLPFVWRLLSGVGVISMVPSFLTVPLYMTAMVLLVFFIGLSYAKFSMGLMVGLGPSSSSTRGAALVSGSVGGVAGVMISTVFLLPNFGAMFTAFFAAGMGVLAVLWGLSFDRKLVFASDHNNHLTRVGSVVGGAIFAYVLILARATNLTIVSNELFAEVSFWTVLLLATGLGALWATTKRLFSSQSITKMASICVVTLLLGIVFTRAVAVFLPRDGMFLWASAALMTSPFGFIGGVLLSRVRIGGLFYLGALAAPFTMYLLEREGTSVETYLTVLGLLALILLKPLRKEWTVSVVYLLAVAAMLFFMSPSDTLSRLIAGTLQRPLQTAATSGGAHGLVENRVSDIQALYRGTNHVESFSDVVFEAEGLSGHLGPLIHPWPRTGLLVDPVHARGIQAATKHPFTQMDLIFSSATRAEMTTSGDGFGYVLTQQVRPVRGFLRGGMTKYDIVTIGADSPSRPGGWSLFTIEFYSLVRSSLNQGGVLVQGIDMDALMERELRGVLAGVLAVFDHVHLFVVSGRDILGPKTRLVLWASNSPLELNYKELELRLSEPRIGKDLKTLSQASKIGADNAVQFLDYYLGGSAAIRDWVGPASAFSDFFALMALNRQTRLDKLVTPRALLTMRSSVLNVLTNFPEDDEGFVERVATGAEAQGLTLSGRFEKAAELIPESTRLESYRASGMVSRDYYLETASHLKGDASGIFECASALGNQGYYEKALELFEKALEISPSDVAIAVNLALAKSDAGEHESALAILEQLWEQDPEHWLVNYNLGSVLIAMGDPGAALGYLQKAVNVQPKHEGLLLAYADANLQMGKKDKAERVVRQILVLNSHNPEAWDLHGLISAAREKWAEARQRHLRALMLDPYRPDSHYNMGIALQHEKRYLEAASAYRAALFIEPRDAEAQNNLGLLYASAGLFEMAIEAYRAALEIEPHYSLAAYNLGLAYQALGQVMPAAEAYGLALKMAPDLEEARQRLLELGIDKVEMDLADDAMMEKGN